MIGRDIDGCYAPGIDEKYSLGQPWPAAEQSDPLGNWWNGFKILTVTGKMDC